MPNRFAPSFENLNASTMHLEFSDLSLGKPISFRDAYTLWKTSADFRACFSENLAGVRSESYFWETPPITAGELDRRFECVLVAAPGLRRAADPTPFAAKFSASREARAVIAFANLSGDAELVVPRDLGGGANYAHLAVFLRTAPINQVDTLWRIVGERVEARLAAGRPFWLSTAGMGVAWLHVRIDATPKYYSHDPYRRLSAERAG
jgi:hypothetical protein